MKYLYYTTYCRGGSGLSNGIMSIELGVILAHLMDRVLILDGNASPRANLVEYGDETISSNRSRITDLIELPVPWLDAEEREIDPSGAPELSDRSLMDVVFYYPPQVDTSSADFKAFANGRTTFVTESRRCREEWILRLSGGPEVGENKLRLHNLSFYSYFFYFDEPTRRRVHSLLRRMQPRRELAQLAGRIAADLGEFNAVHIRRGDFKKTFGVTTLERKPSEVLDTLDHHFDRNRTLLILTDEMSDPFFHPILRHYDGAVFADQLILERYRDELLALPYRDNIALAFLSQLVASHSADFVGSMTSTFSALIQRYRGNAGRPEPFKFLWNEIPDEGDEIERGRHGVSHCVPLEHGVMVEEFEGPYSWNRFNRRINPAWMREWPESFLRAEEPESRLPAENSSAAEPAGGARKGMGVAEEPSAGRKRSAPGDEREVEVQLFLLGGHRHTVTLRANSELLHDLFSALAASTKPHPRPLPRLFQIPANGGHSVCSFSSSQLVSIVTEPPVLISGDGPPSGDGVEY